METTVRPKLGRLVDIPGVGALIRYSSQIPGGAILVEYRPAELPARADTAHTTRRRPRVVASRRSPA